MFEDAARQHKRYEKVVEVLKLRDELARDVDRLHGVAITRSIAQECVDLWFVATATGRSRSVSASKPTHAPSRSTANCATRSRWWLRASAVFVNARSIWRCWRAGITPPGATAEWIGFESFDDIPYRKLVNAISRVARREGPL